MKSVLPEISHGPVGATRFLQLRSRLQKLKENHGLAALKTGTEVEDMGFEEIRVLRQISAGIVPLYVKIGGPEARNDIRNLIKLEVDGLIAPMIESPYALVKFIESLTSLLEPDAYKKLKKGINIETITGLYQLDAILALPEADQLDQITAARTDLCASMALPADHFQVLDSCAYIKSQAQQHGLVVSLGGQIEPSISPILIEKVKPNFINSRHMVLAVPRLDIKPATAVIENLRFECELYLHLSEVFFEYKTRYTERIETINQRLSK